MKIKSILVPTDFSTCANNAANMAIDWAKQAKAEVHFLHIPHTPVEWKELRKEQERHFPETKKLIARAHAALNRLEAKAQQAGLKAKQFMVFDRTSDEIIAHIKKHKIDLVVMGSHGSKGMHEVVIGSNAQKIVRRSPVPVLVAKERPKKVKFKRLLFASDFSKRSLKPFAQMIELNAMLKAHGQLLYVDTPTSFEESEETYKRLAPYSKKAPKHFTTHLENAYAVDRGVLQFAEANQNDLIVLSTAGRSAVQQLLSHSIAEAIVNHAKVSVLVLKS